MIITCDIIHGHAVADGSLIYVLEREVVENELVAYRIYVIYFHFVSHERFFWMK